MQTLYVQVFYVNIVSCFSRKKYFFLYAVKVKITGKLLKNKNFSNSVFVKENFVGQSLFERISRSFSYVG